jgi:hypothetical protein
MGVMIAFAVFLLGILAAAISRLLSDDIKEWAPWITDRLVKRAVRGLPVYCKARLDEEWRSHLDEIPGHIGKLIVAVGFFLANRNINKLEHRTARAKKRVITKRKKDIDRAQQLLDRIKRRPRAISISMGLKEEKVFAELRWSIAEDKKKGSPQGPQRFGLDYWKQILAESESKPDMTESERDGEQ